MDKTYDAIIVGARCAGSPAAMLLARKGWRVLLVDKATFPSDTMSTHIIHPPGVAALKRWNLLPRLLATGCAPLTQYTLDFGPIAVGGPLRARDGVSFGVCPRRTVLDKLLVDAAGEAGVEVHEGVTVTGLVSEGGRVAGIRGHAKGGAPFEARARVVVGADGMRSFVAEAVAAPRYNEHPTITCGYYAYWSGLPAAGFVGHIRPERAFAVAPTNDGLTMIVMCWPRSQFFANRSDVEGHFMRALELAPALVQRMGGARRQSRFVGTGDLPNFFRKPYGPGWVLIGDAGYHKDPITAQGISDAFRDAEAMAQALDDVFAGRAGFEEALSAYQNVRDAAALPMFDLTRNFADLEHPPPPEMQQLFAAMQGNPHAMRDFVSTIAGVISPTEFFAEDNIRRIMAGAATVG